MRWELFGGRGNILIEVRGRGWERGEAGKGLNINTYNIHKKEGRVGSLGGGSVSSYMEMLSCQHSLLH